MVHGSKSDAGRCVPHAQGVNDAATKNTTVFVVGMTVDEKSSQASQKFTDVRSCSDKGDALIQHAARLHPALRSASDGLA